MSKVLVAEDERDIRVLLSIMLREEGHEPIEACNGLEAVEVAQREKPDLILMDMMMPILDGFEATERILQDEEMKDTPIVAVSANCWDFDWKKKAKSVGCSGCHRKPIEFRELEELLRAYGY